MLLSARKGASQVHQVPVNSSTRHLNIVWHVTYVGNVRGKLMFQRIVDT